MSSKEKVGQRKLFWLTAYLQLGNCVLNTFHLSNIYKYVIWNLTATSHTETQLSSTCLPPVSSHFRTAVSMPHHAGRILALQVPCQQEWLEIGSTLSICGPLSYGCMYCKTHWIQPPLLPLQTTSPPFTALSNRLLCTKRLGGVAPLLEGQGLPTLAGQG